MAKPLYPHPQFNEAPSGIAAAGGGTIQNNLNEYVYNQDVVSLYDAIQRAIYEVLYSVSGSITAMNTFDTTRLLSYLDNIDALHAWVVSQPQLDLPETHPFQFTLQERVEPQLVESDFARDIARMLSITREELVAGQSSRMPAGLISFDSTRLTAMITKVRNYVTSYVPKVNPLDTPESAPMKEMTGPGAPGVDPV